MDLEKIKQIGKRVLTKPGYRILAGLAIATFLGYSTLKSDFPEPEESKSMALFEEVVSPSVDLIKDIPLVGFLDSKDIPYKIENGVLVIEKEAIQTISNSLGLDRKQTIDYLCTNDHRPLTYNPNFEAIQRVIYDGIMKVESGGRPRCNSAGYCGLMQIGKSALSATLEAMVSVNSEKNYFRLDKGTKLRDDFELINQHSQGDLVILAQINFGVAQAREKANSAYEQYDQAVKKAKGEDWNVAVQQRKQTGKLLQYLRRVNSYLNHAINQTNPSAQKMARKEASLLEAYVDTDFSAQFNSLFGDELPPSLNPKIIVPVIRGGQLSAEAIRKQFDSLWDKAALNYETENNQLNITVARVYLELLDQDYENRAFDQKGELIPQYQSAKKHIEKNMGRKLDHEQFKLAWTFEAYNKGSHDVDRRIRKAGQLVPTDRLNGEKRDGYFLSVMNAITNISTYNTIFYGTPDLSCATADGGETIKCQLPPKGLELFSSRS